MRDIRGKEQEEEEPLNIEQEFQRGFTDGEFLVDDYIARDGEDNHCKDEDDIHNLIDDENTAPLLKEKRIPLP